MVVVLGWWPVGAAGLASGGGQECWLLPRSDYTRVGRGHDQELDMDMEYDSPPTSLMEAMARAGIKISLGSSSTSTSTAVYDDNIFQYFSEPKPGVYKGTVVKYHEDNRRLEHESRQWQVKFGTDQPFDYDESEMEKFCILKIDGTSTNPITP